MRARYGPTGRAKSCQDAAYHFSYLADSLDTNSPALFNDDIGWVKALLQQHGVLHEDLDHIAHPLLGALVGLALGLVYAWKKGAFDWE